MQIILSIRGSTRPRGPSAAREGARRLASRELLEALLEVVGIGRTVHVTLAGAFLAAAEDKGVQIKAIERLHEDPQEITRQTLFRVVVADDGDQVVGLHQGELDSAVDTHLFEGDDEAREPAAVGNRRVTELGRGALALTDLAHAFFLVSVCEPEGEQTLQIVSRVDVLEGQIEGCDESFAPIFVMHVGGGDQGAEELDCGADVLDVETDAAVGIVHLPLGLRVEKARLSAQHRKNFFLPQCAKRHPNIANIGIFVNICKKD